ncbi:MAG: hypothetical protein ACTH8F_00080 [Microbacterium sp.]|uniref:hypothetical protein n=1 Tax=Microbacterium sp. TaxID=51671 RepID=UPI003F959240
MTTAAANQQIIIDAEVLHAHIRALADAADVFKAAAANAAGGIGVEAFGGMCGPMLGPAVSELANASESTLAAASALSAATSAALEAIVGDFSEIEETAVTTFRAIEGLAH